MERIGLFGGSFDPVHLGHLLVARAACEEFSLDRIYFIPAARSPFKPDFAPADDRARMQLLRLALAGNPRMRVDSLELDRGGTSFSINTVRAYARRIPEAKLFWLIGADHVPTLHKWRDAPQLAKSVEFLIIPRPGQADTKPPDGFTAHHLRGFPLGVSSSQIRARVQQGLPIDYLTGSAVANSIRDNGLYL
ncbi:MAG: nicotinate (nicotinamide) nucleotide adenylyltransferase [Verrucomicrobiae bacterium]|nr:nicotinate (nicotinamide) nucleotide adenylyltransferase [Verrucomicrobiae bacterium]